MLEGFQCPRFNVPQKLGKRRAARSIAANRDGVDEISRHPAVFGIRPAPGARPHNLIRLPRVPRQQNFENRQAAPRTALPLAIVPMRGAGMRGLWRSESGACHLEVPLRSAAADRTANSWGSIPRPGVPANTPTASPRVRWSARRSVPRQTFHTAQSNAGNSAGEPPVYCRYSSRNSS